jgi:hypothetical protein
MFIKLHPTEHFVSFELVKPLYYFILDIHPRTNLIQFRAI